VATGILAAGEIAPATRDVLRRYPNTRVELGEVYDIDLENKVVYAEQMGRQLETPTTA